MRALIRGKEVCLESGWSQWQRMNMLFLLGKEKDDNGNPLPGDGWTLVEDYHEPVEGSEESPSEPLPEARSDSEGEGDAVPTTVSIGGKEYTLDELKKLIE